MSPRDRSPRPSVRPVAALCAVALVVLLAPPVLAAAAVGTAPPLALGDRTPRLVALTHARLVIAPGRTVEDGTLVVKDGVIVAAGARVAVPRGAYVRDLAGATVYPGLIDLSLPLGIPAPVPPAQLSDGPDGPTGGPGSGGESGHGGPGASSWNPLVTPQRRIERDLVADSLGAALRKTLRGQGITVALAAPSRGIVKGQGAVLALGDGAIGSLVLRPQASLHLTMATPYSFQNRGYPTSPMGAMSLIRQTFLDADWHARARAASARDPRLPRPELDEGLAALAA